MPAKGKRKRVNARGNRRTLLSRSSCLKLPRGERAPAFGPLRAVADRTAPTMGTVAVQYHIQVFMSQKETLGILPSLLARHEADILRSWLAAQVRDRGSGRSGVREQDLRGQSEGFLSCLRSCPVGKRRYRFRPLVADPRIPFRYDPRSGTAGSDSVGSRSLYFFPERNCLPLASIRGRQRSRDNWPGNLARLADSSIGSACLTTEVALKTREEVIARQQVEMLEVAHSRRKTLAGYNPPCR